MVSSNFEIYCELILRLNFKKQISFVNDESENRRKLLGFAFALQYIAIVKSKKSKYEEGGSIFSAFWMQKFRQSCLLFSGFRSGIIS